MGLLRDGPWRLLIYREGLDLVWRPAFGVDGIFCGS
jgi:hypothetical protein